MTLALGQLPVSGIPGIDWCLLFSGPPLNCSGSLPAGTSLLSAALEGAPVNQSPVNQSPVNQSLIDALETAQAPVNQLPVNQLPVNQLPVNQLPVNQSRILSLPGQPAAREPVAGEPALAERDPGRERARQPVARQPAAGQPAAREPVRARLRRCPVHGHARRLRRQGACPAQTLGDLRARARAGDVPDTWTIANLEDFGNLIVGDLLASLPQPNTLTLADVLALALFANNPESFAFETLNIFDTGLSLYADPLGDAPYTVDFTLTPDGGPTGGPSAVDVSVTLPRTFAYAAGSSKLVQSPGTCSSGAAVGEPSLTQVAAGVTKATWTVTGIVGNAYTLCFSARPGIVLGPQSASATAKPDGGALVAAAAPEPVTVVDGTESSNNDPATSRDALDEQALPLVPHERGRRRLLPRSRAGRGHPRHVPPQPPARRLRPRRLRPAADGAAPRIRVDPAARRRPAHRHRLRAHARHRRAAVADARRPSPAGAADRRRLRQPRAPTRKTSPSSPTGSEASTPCR